MGPWNLIFSTGTASLRSNISESKQAIDFHFVFLVDCNGANKMIQLDIAVAENDWTTGPQSWSFWRFDFFLVPTLERICGFQYIPRLNLTVYLKSAGESDVVCLVTLLYLYYLLSYLSLKMLKITRDLHFRVNSSYGRCTRWPITQKLLQILS